MAGRVRIGISGWRYPPWRGVFYPKDLPQHRELEYASRQLPTIELNGSFYSMQRPASWQHWYEQTPKGFVMSVKGPRYLTHILRLSEVEKPLANFFASGVLALREKLGPLLWQFPPSMKFDEERFEAFLAALPRDTDQALKLARKREPRMRGRTWLGRQPRRRLHHAVEIRNEIFRDETFIKLLRRHNVALVVADTAGKWPCLEDVTADFLYLRLHGDEKLYASGYTPQALRRWAEKIGAWRAGREPAHAQRVDGAARKRSSRAVYCYFDNDMKVKAPVDAQALIRRLDR